MHDIPKDLRAAAYHVADRYRAAPIPRDNIEGWPLVQQHLLEELKAASPGYSDQQYKRALSNSLFESR